MREVVMRVSVKRTHAKNTADFSRARDNKSSSMEAPKLTPPADLVALQRLIPAYAPGTPVRSKASQGDDDKSISALVAENVLEALESYRLGLSGLPNVSELELSHPEQLKKTGVKDSYKPVVTVGKVSGAPAVHYQETSSSFGGNTEGSLNVPGDLSHNPKTGAVEKRAGPGGADVNALDDAVGESLLQAVAEASRSAGPNSGILDVVPAKARKSGHAFANWFTQTNSRGYQYHTQRSKDVKATRARAEKSGGKPAGAAAEAAVLAAWTQGNKGKKIRFEDFVREVFKRDHGGNIFKTVHVAEGQPIALDYNDQFVVAFQGPLKKYFRQGAVGMIWFEGLEQYRQAIVLADAKGGANGHIEMPNPLVQKLLGAKNPTPPRGGSGVNTGTRTIHLVVFTDSARAQLDGGSAHLLDSATAKDPSARLKQYLASIRGGSKRSP